jgi:hypothetical protein
MTLATLKTKLQTLTGTSIGQVFFDWKAYTNETFTKTYPCILWQLDGAEFSGDERSTTIQTTSVFTMTMYAMVRFDPNTQDQITVWDTLRGQVKTYINAMNNTAGIQILNIDKIRGQYAGEGLISADQEIGIMYKDIQIKLFC